MSAAVNPASEHFLEWTETMRLRVGAGTDLGHVRELNEDVFMMRPDQGLFVVCDGMGGAPAGEVASQVAAASIVEQLSDERLSDEDPSAMGEESDGRAYLPQTSRLGEAVRRSNQVLYDQAQQDPRQTGMGTTVVGAWIESYIASVAHVGDSRAYLWHDDRLEPLTRDHSLVEAQILAGVLDRESAAEFEHQNVLIRVLGREPDVEVELTEVAVQTGDYRLLCSDGLTRMVSEPAVACTILSERDPQRICDCLIDAAKKNGGADNITVVVVEVTASWWRRLWNRWRLHARRGHDADADPAV